MQSSRTEWRGLRPRPSHALLAWAEAHKERGEGKGEERGGEEGEENGDEEGEWTGKERRRGEGEGGWEHPRGIA